MDMDKGQGQGQGERYILHMRNTYHFHAREELFDEAVVVETVHVGQHHRHLALVVRLELRATQLDITGCKCLR